MEVWEDLMTKMGYGSLAILKNNRFSQTPLVSAVADAVLGDTLKSQQKQTDLYHVVAIPCAMLT